MVLSIEAKFKRSTTVAHHTAADAFRYLDRTRFVEASTHEFLAYLYRLPDGRYSYTPPRKNESSSGQLGAADLKACGGNRPVGDLHNHPRHSPPSVPDLRGFLDEAGEYGVGYRGYVSDNAWRLWGAEVTGLPFAPPQALTDSRIPAYFNSWWGWW